MQSFPAPQTSSFPPRSEVALMASPEGVTKEGYYGLPLLKRPLWGWEIALYFFSEGISAGSFVLSSMADLFGGGQYPSLIRNARILSFLTLLPCPPLLVADLGKPSRFHHMLRILKWSSPMNLGAWALSGYGAHTAALAGIEQAAMLPRWLERSVRRLPARALEVTGLPFAFTMIAYPGVLLSTTSTPVWSNTRFLGAVLATSSMSTAASALTLMSALNDGSDADGTGPLHRLEVGAKITEAAALAAYLCTAGPAARPLLSGSHAREFWRGGVGAGIVMPLALQAAEARRAKRSRIGMVLGSVLSLAGGLLLKWAIVHAGKESAYDAKAARHAMRSTPSTPGWVPQRASATHKETLQ